MTTRAEGWRVLVSAAAWADIREILRWTERRFGAVQANAYATAIADAIAALTAGPATRGIRERVDIDQGLYTLHLSRIRRRARHFIAFRFRNEERRVVDVFRVVHDAMDLARRVPRETSDEEEGST
jgi:toxin ParE1/3/4